MQKELTVQSVQNITTKKDGTPLTGKFGPYVLVKITTAEEGVVTMFSKKASELKAGDKIMGTLEVKEANGFTNKNFTPAKPNQGVDPEAFLSLSKRVTTLELSFERKFEELKADLVFQLTGKFRLDKDVENQKPHPMAQPEVEINGVSLDFYTDLDF